MYIYSQKTTLIKKICERSSNRSFLISGVAGSGKTAIGSAIAEELNCDVKFLQCHQWTSTDDLFLGINISSAVAGDIKNIYVKGILAEVAEISLTQQIVCIIDEFDKTSNHVENLFLDFLQNGRVPVQNNKIIQGNLNNIIMFFTSNGEREHSDPFLRRVRRIHLDRMDSKLIQKIVFELTNVPAHIIKLSWRVLEEISKGKTSLQELQNFCFDLELIETKEDLKNLLYQWGCRDLNKSIKKSKWEDPLWAEIKKLNLFSGKF